ncbi:MAG: hypothetical protein QOC75_3231 [Pseudonocardiales bacterium]|nr:hypothetical protein [Pseudonocardiales bacterium]
MAYGARLESVLGVTALAGSNPASSASDQRERRAAGFPERPAVRRGCNSGGIRRQLTPSGGAPLPRDRSDGVSAEGLAAVDLDQVAVDVAGLVRGEEDREVGDVVDLTPPLERDGIGEGLVEVLVVEKLSCQ